MATYRVRNEQTGQIVTFEWHDEVNPPTDADMEEVFSSAGGQVLTAKSHESGVQPVNTSSPKSTVEEYLKTEGPKLPAFMLPPEGITNVVKDTLGEFASKTTAAALRGVEAVPKAVKGIATLPARIEKALTPGGVTPNVVTTGIADAATKILDPISEAAKFQNTELGAHDPANQFETLPAQLFGGLIEFIPQLAVANAAGLGSVRTSVEAGLEKLAAKKGLEFAAKEAGNLITSAERILAGAVKTGAGMGAEGAAFDALTNPQATPGSMAETGGQFALMGLAAKTAGHALKAAKNWLTKRYGDIPLNKPGVQSVNTPSPDAYEKAKAEAEARGDFSSVLPESEMRQPRPEAELRAVIADSEAKMETLEPESSPWLDAWKRRITAMDELDKIKEIETPIVEKPVAPPVKEVKPEPVIEQPVVKQLKDYTSQEQEAIKALIKEESAAQGLDWKKEFPKYARNPEELARLIEVDRQRWAAKEEGMEAARAKWKGKPVQQGEKIDLSNDAFVQGEVELREPGQRVDRTRRLSDEFDADALYGGLHPNQLRPLKLKMEEVLNRLKGSQIRGGELFSYLRGKGVKQGEIELVLGDIRQTPWVPLEDARKKVAGVGKAYEVRELSNKDTEARGNALYNRPELRLPGGENYRERVFRTPLEKTEQLHQLGDGTWTILKKDGTYINGSWDTKEQAQKILKEMQEHKHYWPDFKLEDKGQRDSHFPDVPNAIGWERVDERLIPTGKQLNDLGGRPQNTYSKIKFLDELQESQWVKQDRFNAKEEVAMKNNTANNPDLFAPEIKRNTHPLLASSKELMLKDSIQEAVASGKEGFGWNTGENVQKRYNLKDRVTELTYYPETGDLTASTGAGGVEFQVERGEIANYVGKEVAQRLLSQPLRDINGHKGYTLGAEAVDYAAKWPFELYDKMIPGIIRDLSKKYNWGVTPEQVKDSAGNTIWHIPITDAMKKSYESGSVELFGGLHPRMLSKGMEWFDATRKRIIERNPELGKRFGSVVRGFFNTVSPGSMMPEGGKWLDLRNETRGFKAMWEQNAKDFTKHYEKLNQEDRLTLHKYLDGQLEFTDLKPELQYSAQTLRGVDNMLGRMLVEAGSISEKEYASGQGNHIRRIYQQFMGEQPPSGFTLHPEQFDPRKVTDPLIREQLGEIRDPIASLADLMVRASGEYANAKYLGEIAGNRPWIFEHSVVKSNGRYIGLNKAQELIKGYKVRQAEGRLNDAGLTHMKELEQALAENEGFHPDFAKARKDYIQLNGAKYGDLDGAFVIKPIAQDLAPLFEHSSTTSGTVDWLKDFFVGSTAAWKTARTAWNLPTWGHNIAGNVLQINMSGTPLAKVPILVSKALTQMAKKGPYYTAQLHNGLFSGNVVKGEYRELIEAATSTKVKGVGAMMRSLEKLSRAYGSIDDVFKLAKAIEVMERGGTVKEATREGLKWGMDYSLMHPAFRYVRNVPFGAPFLSYQVKILPLIAESLAERPWVISKFILIPKLYMDRQMKDMSEDDAKKFRESLPKYVRNGQFFLLPGTKDQVLNMTSSVPWGNWMQIMNSARKGEVVQAVKETGLASGFIPMLMAGITTGRDPRTGKEIVDPLSITEREKLTDTLTWLWKNAAPSPSMLAPGGALDKVREYHQFGKDKQGNDLDWKNVYPKVGGVDIIKINPQTAGKVKAAQVSEARDALRRQIIQMKKQGRKPEEIQELVNKFQIRVREIMKGED